MKVQRIVRETICPKMLFVSALCGSQAPERPPAAEPQCPRQPSHNDRSDGKKIIGAKHRGICQQIGLCFRKGCTFAQKNAVGKDGFQLCRKVAAAHRVTGRDENRIQAFPAIPIPKRHKKSAGQSGRPPPIEKQQQNCSIFLPNYSFFAAMVHENPCGEHKCHNAAEGVTV